MAQMVMFHAHLSLAPHDGAAVGAGRGRAGEHVGQGLVLPRDAKHRAQLPQHCVAASRGLRSW